MTLGVALAVAFVGCDGLAHEPSADLLVWRVRFRTRERFASYNGTAPIEVSSGDRVIYRLSRRGNRQLNYPLTELSER